MALILQMRRKPDGGQLQTTFKERKMAIQKKSLISALKTAKKANIASAQPPEIVTPEALDGKNLKSMTRLSAKKSARGLNMRHAKKNLRSLKKG